MPQTKDMTSAEYLNEVKSIFLGLLECDQAGVTPFVPKSMASGAKAEGRFGKEDFIFIVKDNEYQYPARQRLTFRMATTEHGLNLYRYWSSQCQHCAIKPQCTSIKERRNTLWENESIDISTFLRQVQPFAYLQTLSQMS